MRSLLVAAAMIATHVFAHGATLTANVVESAAAVNLAQVGTTDWARWPGYTHKAASISNVTTTGSTATYDQDPRIIGTRQGIRTYGSFQFTVQANTGEQTLMYYIGGYSATGRVTASLPGAPDFTATFSGTRTFSRVVTIKFKADAAGVLTVRYQRTGTTGEIRMQAAALQGSTVTPPPGPIFSDNFDDGNANGWSIVTQSSISAAWSVLSGALDQTKRVDSTQTYDQTYHLGTYAFLTGGLSFRDYRFTVNVTPLATDSADDVGVMFRYVDASNYYRLSFNARYGFTRLEKKVAGVFTPLAVDSYGYVIGQTMRLAVDARGSQLRIYHNDDPLFGVEDVSLSAGTVALYAQNRARFDNVVIETPNNVPRVTLSSPQTGSVNVSNQLSVSAIASGVPSGGRVDFELDGGSVRSDSVAPFVALYTGLGTGEHTVAAVLRDAGGVELARDTNRLVGTGGQYFIAVGDSITNGMGDNFAGDNTSQNGRIRATGGYEAALTDLLQASSGAPVIVFNEGISGDRSAHAAAERVRSIRARHPGSQNVLVQLGTNDATSAIPSGGGCTGTACNYTYKGNMQYLINQLTSVGKKVHVAIAPPYFGPYGGTPFANPLAAPANATHMQAYNNVVRNELTGRQLGPNLFDYFLSPTVNRFSLYADNLHPNALGYLVIAHLWRNSLASPAIPLPFVLGNLAPSTVAPYFKQNLLEAGDAYYVDAAFALTSVPTALRNGRWVMTANSGVGNTSNNYVSFTVDRAVTVYVAYDGGATNLPGWASAFTNTGLTIGTTNPASPTLRVYSRAFNAGAVVLGGNRAAGSSGADANYVAILVAN